MPLSIDELTDHNLQDLEFSDHQMHPIPFVVSLINVENCKIGNHFSLQIL